MNKTVHSLRLNSIRSTLLILLALLILASALLTVPLVIASHTRNQPRLTLHELVRLIEGRPLVMDIADLERVITSSPPLANTTAAERIVADQIGMALGIEDQRVRVMLDEDDRENGPEYEKRLALYGEEERSSLAIDGAFQVAVQRQDDRWLIISHESAPRLGYLRILALRVTLVGILVLICLWFASRIVRPLQNLAGAANRFAGSIEINSIPLEGPDEVRTVAAAFNRMNEQIVAYLTERTTMLLAIAHDLRMPLARIRFQNALGSPNACTSIGRDIGQMERMIGTMLQFAEGKGGRTEMDTLDLPSLADAVVQNLIDSGSDVEFEQTAPITLIGDQVLLKRMLENLIDNAVKYGGSARVVTEKEGSVVHVEVSDDGPGMTSEQIAWACEPFYRADSSRGSERGGTGLGLTIVEMVASVHGGSVNIQNRNTGGLAVRVTLPLHGKA